MNPPTFDSIFNSTTTDYMTGIFGFFDNWIYMGIGIITISILIVWLINVIINSLDKFTDNSDIERARKVNAETERLLKK